MFFSAVSVSKAFGGKKTTYSLKEHWSITCGLDPIPPSCPMSPTNSSLSLFNMPSLCCLKDSHKGGIVGSCKKQGQERTKPRGWWASRQNAASPSTTQCFHRWPVACLLLDLAGSGLASLPPLAGVWGFGHTYSHLPALFLLLSHSLTPCSPLPCVIGSNCKSKSKQAILNTNWYMNLLPLWLHMLLHVGLFPRWSQAPFLSLSQMNHNHNASPKTHFISLKHNFGT